MFVFYMFPPWGETDFVYYTMCSWKTQPLHVCVFGNFTQRKTPAVNFTAGVLQVLKGKNVFGWGVSSRCRS